MLYFKQSFLLGCILGILSLSSLAAQPQLERISITERGDGNGYVLRYHLTEMVDSYELIQPETNRIQMQLLSAGINSGEVQMPGPNDDIISVELTPLNGGVGVDIVTSQDIFFVAETYPDRNMRDLLVNLEYATQADAEAMALETDLYDWAVSDITDVAAEAPSSETGEQQEDMQREDGEQSPVVGREPLSVKIGISGGFGISNKLGGNYTAESRQEFLMGVSAGISLPFILPYSIKPGIETGVFFVQKGFLNPTVDRFGGETVVLDYVEVPVLARLSYDLTPRIKPKAVGGFYTAFRANAEVVQRDGDRDDLNDVTKSVDFGLVAGIGSDFEIQNTTISIQTHYAVGLPPLFTGNFSGKERPGFLTLLLGVRF